MHYRNTEDAVYLKSQEAPPKEVIDIVDFQLLKYVAVKKQIRTFNLSLKLQKIEIHWAWAKFYWSHQNAPNIEITSILFKK